MLSVLRPRWLNTLKPSFASPFTYHQMIVNVLRRTAIVGVVAVPLLLSARFATSLPLRISVLPSLQVDASTYDSIALGLSQTWSLDSVPPLQPPGFVTFLAVVYTLFGHSWIAGRLALWLCLVTATCLSALLARKMYRSTAAGWCSALLCATSPALQAYSGTLQYELLASVWLLGLLWAAERGSAGHNSTGRVQIAWFAALGIATGIAVLTREIFVVVAPVIGAYAFTRLSPSRGKAMAAMLVTAFLGCAAAPPVIWSALQSGRAGRMVAVSDKGPLVMAFGNNPVANGTFNAPLAGVQEPSGWAFIRSQPREAAWLACRKILYFWGILRDGWNVPRPSAVFVARTTGGGLTPAVDSAVGARGSFVGTHSARSCDVAAGDLENLVASTRRDCSDHGHPRHHSVLVSFCHSSPAASSRSRCRSARPVRSCDLAPSAGPSRRCLGIGVCAGDAVRLLATSV